MLTLVDAVEVVGKPRKTADGYLVADARIARTGIQEYFAGELGLTDRDPRDVIRVYRPEEEVFHKDSLRSMTHRPMTDDHPLEPVTADNWKRLAIGSSADEVARDGDWIRVPLTLMDAAAIRAWEDGKRGLSVGYTCDLVMDSGTTPKGEVYDAVQRSIRANHIALCDNPRAGPHARIGDRQQRRDDVAPPSKDPTMKTLTIDGIPVADVSPAAEAVIVKLQGQLADATGKVTTADTKIGELTASVAAKDGEIAALNSKLKDAEVTPAKLQEMADARAAVIADAKKVFADIDPTGKTEGDIRRAAVAHKLGDAAKDMSDDAIAGAFKVLVPAGDSNDNRDPVRDAIRDNKANVSDADKARQEMIDEMRGEKRAA